MKLWKSLRETKMRCTFRLKKVLCGSKQPNLFKNYIISFSSNPERRPIIFHIEKSALDLMTISNLDSLFGDQNSVYNMAFTGIFFYLIYRPHTTLKNFEHTNSQICPFFKFSTVLQIKIQLFYALKGPETDFVFPGIFDVV